MGKKEDEIPLIDSDVEESGREVDADQKKEEQTNIPDLSYWEVFRLFLGFGLHAWGGPVAQIDMVKQQLVIQEKWISVAKFNRVLAVYQVLPGPEATELCCYFGMLAKGRIGSLLGGLGFMLPGFILMLTISWLYDTYGIENEYVNASFTAIQPCINAMIFRAVHRLAEHAFQDPETHQFSGWLFMIGAMSAIQSVLKINFFITLAFSGLFYSFVFWQKLWGYVAAFLLTAGGLAGYIVYVVYEGYPEDVTFGSGEIGGRGDSYLGLFLLGLFAGLLTFGGAYTTIPFIRQDAVVAGGWMTSQQFLDGLAIGSILPSPLVIISTFVGFMGGEFPGAILMTIGMFLPAFSFTLLGHDLFEAIVNNKRVTIFLDGVTAGVIGLVFVTAFQLLKSAVTDSIGAVLFVLSLMALQQFKHKYTQVVIVFAAATVGQVLYIDE
eukprot:TRINITY_DN1820_c0_g8_i1.p1 TRINITY_DN1820_c0_g8~~TRINITY_DN1820_c0_g8_i1.p1  ORF type:complete len:437 (-),score=80.37 TRINITY_DN1820_c0_g8_i1:15-1325(-)